ncbi:MAG: polyphosphate kinase 2 family protein [Thermoanaerobaculia bacterium]|nr:polyphosphate kinase 2 family protein [Thermoanaerobaculia bacterium]
MSDLPDDPHRIAPGSPVDLARLPTRADAFHDDREAAEREFRELREELADLQYRLYAEDRRKLLVVLQALDAGGKDGTIRKLTRGVNPQGVEVTSFKVPSKLELAHDFLWRIHRRVPGNGKIGIFNRSHYEDVLVVRVDEIVPETVWRPRYELINQFERLLSETGTTVLKFFLHISREEQLERFQARLDTPEKRWKFSRDDLRKREQWEAYREAYQEALTRCTTEWAPWRAIPADQKWYRNLAVARVVVGALRQMDPRFPEPEEDLDALRLSG